LGTSSVPKISSGSKSRLEKAERGKPWDCNWEHKKGLTENLLSNGTLLLWSAAFLDGLLSLVRYGLGVFPLEQGEKMWGDGSVCEWIYRAPRGLFY
jgi:hypothetical protein